MVNSELIGILFFSILVMGSFGIWVYLLFALKKSFDFSPRIIHSNELQSRKSIDDCFISIIIELKRRKIY